MRTIVVAVDFGTTFSGVAWAQADHPDTHYIIDQWPQTRNSSIASVGSKKVPTEIAYEYDHTATRCIWGFQIPNQMPRLQWIKLGLSTDSKVLISPHLSNYSESLSTPIPRHTTAHGVVIDYLRCLNDHIIQTVRAKVGRSFDDISLRYVITVPAIWSDKAKVATLECANKAGFGEPSNIQIISEPEAAAIHSLRVSSPHGLEVDNTIVICDAGGGTVDLIAFSVVELYPHLRLKEVAPGKGGLCGSTFINRRFEEWLTKRLSSCPRWKTDTREEAMSCFEEVKQRFSGDLNQDNLIFVPGMQDSEDVGIHRSRLWITESEMVALFEPVLQQIKQLIDDQVQASMKKVDAIFLVGGFGQSPYLHNYLHNFYSPAITVFAPADGWTAVVRGALSKAMGQVSPKATKPVVESRVARKHYGQISSEKFIAGEHDRKKRYWDNFYGEYRIHVMKWFIPKGDDIKENESIKTTWLQKKLRSDGNFDSIRVTIYELDTPNGEKAPLYFNRHMKPHANLQPSLNQIERSRIPVLQGRDGQPYYQDTYEVSATYFSAHCEYSLYYEGKDHGSVKVDYL